MPTTEMNNVSGEDGVPDIRQLKVMIDKFLGTPANSPPPTTKPRTCSPTDYKCQVLKLNMLSPPGRLEPVPGLKTDPCSPTSLCGTWKHTRQFVTDNFAKRLTNGTFRPDAFTSDENSMWSTQGGQLWLESQNLAKNTQVLGPTYMNQLIYKANLDLLAETRYLRLDLQDNSTSLLLYVLCLGIPGVLLTAVYMTLTMRTWYKTGKNTRLRKQLKRQEDEAILKAARPGQRVQVLSAEQSALLQDIRTSK